MERASRCEDCGALATAGARCRYCGAVPRASDLVAVGFGPDEDAFGIMSDAEGVRVQPIGRRALRVDVPPASEVGPAVVGCAWTRGTFVDLDVSVAIRFEREAEGIRAGCWLRSTTASAICVTLSPNGAIDAVVRREQGRSQEVLASIPPPPRLPSGGVFVLRARVEGDRLTVYRNGTPLVSVRCPTSLSGGADLVVEVPAGERGTVMFEDANARLP